jgi:acyl-CoA thioesterase I
MLRPKTARIYLIFQTLMLTLCVTAIAADSTTAPAAKPLEPPGRPGAIKLACVGDSITFGAGVKDRAHDSYPAQLAVRLGEKYDVRNFGVSGRTLLKSGDKPYAIEKRYKAALSYAPYIVVIMLGTNDSKPQNWSHKDDFVADYKSLIESFREVNPNVKIYACLPVPAFPGFGGIREEIISGGVIPLVRQAAEESKVDLIDLHAAMADQKQDFPDTVHPNPAGAGLMADAVAKALLGESAPTTAPSTQAVGVGQ